MAAKACDDKKAKDIKLIKIDKVSFISEWILIAEGLSDVQVRSITNSGYSIPNAYKSLGGALKELIEKTRKKKKRSFFEDRLDALRKSAEKARSELSQQEGSEKSVSSENVYGQ